MNGFGFGVPVVCLVALGLVACSAAGDPGTSSVSPDPPLKIDTDSLPPSGGDVDPPRQVGNEMPTTDVPLVPGTRADGEGDGAPPALPCDCSHDLPGIQIDPIEGGVAITVALPNGGAAVLEAEAGSVSTTEKGVDIAGDVTVDLGAARVLPLVDAQLHVGQARGGGATLDGSAKLSGSLLAGTGCGCEGSLLPASLGLALGSSAELLDTDALAALSLSLALPATHVDTTTLPVASDTIALVSPKIQLITDGDRKLVTLDGRVSLEAGASAWAPIVPLAAAGNLEATVRVRDGSVLDVALEGDVELEGSGLICASTPLMSLDLPDAKVVLNREGARLTASTSASLHPGFALSGEAIITLTLGEDDWAINVCGGVMTSLLGSPTGTSQCLDLGKGGVTPCRLPVN